MQIVDGAAVSFHYTLKNDAGEVLDSSSGGEPMTYLHGSGNIVPGLERELTGKVQGTHLEVRVEPVDAYGLRDRELEEVPRQAFPPGLEIKKGMMFQAETPEGHVVPLWVADVKGDTVFVDPNHPLAGVTLHFTVDIVEVRAATGEELAHGHVHGPGGHHHH
jgi:FKBP-type peptidyl-prolyl cis-trans isomerase SlyD